MNHSLHQIVYSIFGLLFLAFLFMSYSGNAPNGYTGAPGDGTCGGCHSGNSLNMDGDIQITGFPTSIIPNNTYSLTVTVSNPDGQSLTAGFSSVCLDSSGGGSVGTLSNPSTGSTVSTGFRDYFNHNPAQPYDANRNAIWTVDWTAPAGPANEVITFYGIGNITDSFQGVSTGSDYVVSSSVSGTLNGAMQFPDLTASNLVGWNATYSPGEIVFFDFDLNNIGNIIASGDYNISAYLSTDPIFDPSDFFGGDLTTGNTGIGTISPVTAAITVPASLPPGSYYLIIVVDTFSEIAESNENNNILVSGSSTAVQAMIPVVLNTGTTGVSCYGMFDGTATVSPSGGNSPYTYSWSNGMTTQTITNLSAGSYQVTVMDANNVSVNDVVVVTEPAELVFSISNTMGVQCSGDATGSASPSITGGTTPYNIMWPGNSNLNLVAGIYVATVTDANNCSDTVSFEIFANDTTPPTVLLNQVTAVSLDNNGAASVPNASIYDNGSVDNCGGALSFTASETNFTCADLGIVSINVEVADGAGNVATMAHNVEVQDLIPPVVTFGVGTLDCDGVFNYNLPSVSDNCDQNITPTLISGLPSGAQFPVGTSTIIYQAVDASGNSATDSMMITVPPFFEASITHTDADCFGAPTGAATVNTMNGNVPLQYLWSNNATTQSINNVTAGNYSVTVTDGNGCAIMSTVTIGEGEEIAISIDLIMNDDGAQNGAIFITASGGSPGYTYNWTDANGVVVSTAEDPQDLTLGLYTVTIMDNAGCMVTSQQIQVLTVVSVDEIDLENGINIFPNPSSGIINVELDFSNTSDTDLEVFDHFGKLIFKNKMSTNQNHELDLTQFPKGLYWFKFIVEDESTVRKIIVSK